MQVFPNIDKSKLDDFYKKKEHFNREYIYLISNVLDVDICNPIKNELNND